MSSTAIKRAAPAQQITAQVGTAQVFTLASNTLLACTLPCPGKGALEQKQFRIRAEGNAQTAGAYTLKPALLGAPTSIPANPTTAASWTTICSGTARSIATTWAPWWIEATLIYDSNSGLLQGVFEQMVNNLYDLKAVITGVLTGLNGTNFSVLQGATNVAPADPIAYFALALTFGTAGANVGNMANFEISF